MKHRPARQGRAWVGATGNYDRNEFSRDVCAGSSLTVRETVALVAIDGYYGRRLRIRKPDWMTPPIHTLQYFADGFTGTPRVAQ